MPANVNGQFLGTAQVFQNAVATQPFLIMAALLAVHIILGALMFLWLAGFHFFIMALIGVVLLNGLVKKTAS